MSEVCFEICCLFNRAFLFQRFCISGTSDRWPLTYHWMGRGASFCRLSSRSGWGRANLGLITLELQQGQASLPRIPC
jgi:hypothetical protein